MVMIQLVFCHNIVLAWRIVQGSTGCSLSLTFGTESSSGGQRGWRYGQCHSSDDGDSDDSNYDEYDNDYMQYRIWTLAKK